MRLGPDRPRLTQTGSPTTSAFGRTTGGQRGCFQQHAIGAARRFVLSCEIPPDPLLWAPPNTRRMSLPQNRSVRAVTSFRNITGECLRRGHGHHCTLSDTAWDACYTPVARLGLCLCGRHEICPELDTASIPTGLASVNWRTGQFSPFSSMGTASAAHHRIAPRTRLHSHEDLAESASTHG
jgi:hypothetical protein